MNKKEIDIIDAVPSKRLFWSIIADYDINRSLCELIDNSLDMWTKNNRKAPIQINIEIDLNQQTIEVLDNAGGVKKSELIYIISPGQTSNINPEQETIGLFGVGTKRAVVALAQDVKIITRHRKEKSYQIEFTDEWLNEENWNMPVYEVDTIQEGSTLIELKKLRYKLSEDDINTLKDHLKATYAMFLYNSNVLIRVCKEKLEPITFQNWAYPPDYPPQRFNFDIVLNEGTVKIDIIAGLCKESSPIGGEYGVYFYCNNRLIARGLKTVDVGYGTGLAGLPHPNVSLAKVIIYLSGDPSLMPWNSSKSGINTSHVVYLSLRDKIFEMVKYYSSLSRRFEGQWPDKVFKYDKGAVNEVPLRDSAEVIKSYFLPLPKSRTRYADKVNQKNKRIAHDKPWTKGIYESIIAVDIIFKQKLEQKNRIALILLDSTLEISFKEFLVHDSGKYYSDKELQEIFKARNKVHDEIKIYTNIDEVTWKKISHYNGLRNKLIHERASAGISDSELTNFREVVQSVLKKLFKLKF
jgi:hypothetical protein